ncbi:MAG: hypothetical protein J2P58_08165 [Acidimicrobiaceae bacterium]|nr:hypothetical protein [Acidimicrobiaceae bacterium]MBO0747317.1 hypothetical protein [Acidimicrobiaceae bacterium]
MISCLSPNGTTTVEARLLPDRLVVGTLEGVVTAERDGQEWEVVAHGLNDLHIASVHYEPTRGQVYVCAYAGGIFVSDDGGVTWQEIDHPLGDRMPFTIASRTLDDRVHLYVGTEPVALFTSSDDGRSWSELPAIKEVPGTEHWTFPAPPHAAHLKSITFDPTDDHAFFVSVEQGGLFFTSDDGEHFVELEGVALEDDAVYKDVHRVVIDPSNRDRLFITGGDGLSVSEDRGETWRRVHGRTWTIGYPDAMVIDPREPSRLYYAGGAYGPGQWRRMGTANAHVARSRDGGQTWEIADSGLPDPVRGNIEAMSLSSAPDASCLYLGTTDGEVYESRDGADSWQLVLKGIAPVSKGGHYAGLQQR